MRNLAKVLERLDETVTAFEIREKIRSARRNKPYVPQLKSIREDREAEAAYRAAQVRKAKAMKRDASGRFVAKRTRSARSAK